MKCHLSYNWYFEFTPVSEHHLQLNYFIYILAKLCLSMLFSYFVLVLSFLWSFYCRTVAGRSLPDKSVSERQTLLTLIGSARRSNQWAVVIVPTNRSGRLVKSAKRLSEKTAAGSQYRADLLFSNLYTFTKKKTKERNNSGLTRSQMDSVGLRLLTWPCFSINMIIVFV